MVRPSYSGWHPGQHFRFNRLTLSIIPWCRGPRRPLSGIGGRPVPRIVVALFGVVTAPAKQVRATAVTQMCETPGGQPC
jgi:hypothetical protein